MRPWLLKSRTDLGDSIARGWSGTLAKSQGGLCLVWDLSLQSGILRGDQPSLGRHDRGPAAYAFWGFYCLSGYLMTLILNEKYGLSPSSSRHRRRGRTGARGSSGCWPESRLAFESRIGPEWAEPQRIG
jgi:hypothetical protein